MSLATAMTIQVAVGIVRRQRQVLVALRPTHREMGGLWEFPGGKLEPGETVAQALARELTEEIGITVQATEPLVTVTHCYPSKQVQLQVYWVHAFSGTPTGNEGQEIRWVSAAELTQLDFLPANEAIIAAITSRL